MSYCACTSVLDPVLTETESAICQFCERAGPSQQHRSAADGCITNWAWKVIHHLRGNDNMMRSIGMLSAMTPNADATYSTVYRMGETQVMDRVLADIETLAPELLDTDQLRTRVNSALWRMGFYTYWG